MNNGTDPDNVTPAEPVMLTVDGVAALLACSPRTVYRLADDGRMPPPVRLGALVRWPRQTIDAWIAAGCPKCKRPGRQ
jgi:excisionase family DNA binding protein